MTHILKLTLGPGPNVVRTEGGIARVLGVGWQAEGTESVLRLWVEAEQGGEIVEDRFYAAGTGQTPPPGEFVGTAVGPTYVAHVFRQKTA